MVQFPPQMEEALIEETAQPAPVKYMFGAPIHFIWTEEALASLRELWTKGLTGSQIAKELTKKYDVILSRNSVIGKAHRLGLESRQGPQSISPKIKKPKPLIKKKLLPRVVTETIEATAVIDESESIPTTAVKLADLEEHHCHWPIGDPTKEDFVFCGASKWHDDKPYCAAHHIRAHTSLHGRPIGFYRFK